jgi:hypothetical protein
MIWLLIIILLVIAFGGGIFINPLLFLVLLFVALAVILSRRGAGV